MEKSTKHKKANILEKIHRWNSQQNYVYFCLTKMEMQTNKEQRCKQIDKNHWWKKSQRLSHDANNVCSMTIEMKKQKRNDFSLLLHRLVIFKLFFFYVHFDKSFLVIFVSFSCFHFSATSSCVLSHCLSSSHWAHKLSEKRKRKEHKPSRDLSISNRFGLSTVCFFLPFWRAWINRAWIV